MVIAFPIRASESTAKTMLQKLLESSQIDEEGVFSVPFEPWEIDLLSCYTTADMDIENDEDDEDEANL